VTGEISQNVTRAAEGAKIVAGVLDQVTHSVTRTSNAVHTVFEASQSVDEAAAALQKKVEDFLRQVAA
jgi:hypothetical protein